MLDLERAAAPHNENNGSTAPDLYRDTEGTTGAVLRSGTGRFAAKRFGFEFHQTINQSEDVAGCDSFLLSFFVLFWGGKWSELPRRCGCSKPSSLRELPGLLLYAHLIIVLIYLYKPFRFKVASNCFEEDRNWL